MYVRRSDGGGGHRRPSVASAIYYYFMGVTLLGVRLDRVNKKIQQKVYPMAGWGLKCNWARGKVVLEMEKSEDLHSTSGSEILQNY